MEAGGALTWLRKNVARNEDDGLWRRGCVHVEACDWTAYVHGDEDQSPNEKPKPDAAPETSPNVSPNPAPNPRLERDDWDVLVGSDLVYNEDGVRYLPRVVRHFLTSQKRKTYFLYAHTKYRYELRDMALWKEFDTCGLEVEEVREEGAPSPPSSPEPLTQLFPEKRIAVLRITLRVAES